MVIHLAAFKAVGESVKYPLKYYNNNIGGLINLLTIMKIYNVNNLIFSSSATVYGNPVKNPIPENAVISASSPYGHTKLMCEQIIIDICKSSDFNAVILRYFNPVGCHFSGIIGDNPEKPDNLFPCLMDVIKGNKQFINVYGGDYDTSDGTCIRDYIHVNDLSCGHVKALSYILTPKNKNISIFNLGTGKGYSVIEVINEFNKQIKNIKNIKLIKYVIVERRKGDIPVIYADSILAINELQWVPVKKLCDMVKDTLNTFKK